MLRRVCCHTKLCRHSTLLHRQYGVKTFDDMGLHPAILQRLGELGVDTPTYIQNRSIPPTLCGENVLCHSETGSGKTLCYLLPLLHNVLTKKGSQQYLVFVPTAELGLQVQHMYQHFKPAELVNSEAYLWQGPVKGRTVVEKEAPLIITTFSKLSQYNYYQIFGHMPTIVMDEADVFHTPSSKDNTHKILGTLVDPLRYIKTIDTVPKKKQLLFVGASFDTMTKRSSGNNLRKWLHFHNIKAVEARSSEAHQTPVTLTTEWRYIEKEDFTRELLACLYDVFFTEDRHVVSDVPEGFEELEDEGPNMDKPVIHIPDDIKAIDEYPSDDDTSVLIFVNNAESVDVLHKTLVNYFRSSPNVEVREMARKVYRLSGSLNVEERAAVMKRIQKGKLRILIATDIAARGIDIPYLDVVINAQLPRDGVGYMHRAGRTARMGESGLVLNFLTNHDVELYNGLFDIYRRKIPRFDRLFKGELTNSKRPERELSFKEKQRDKERWASDHQTSHQFIGSDKRAGFKIKPS